MSKFCCFFCPTNDFDDKKIDDTCPTCNRQYDFALKNLPTKIGNYEVVRELGRGFYGVAYVVKGGTFQRPFVVKISPTSFYTFFESKQPFLEESELHNQIANLADHVIGIVDAFTETITFSDTNATTLECNISVLEFVDGNILKDYLEGKIIATASVICQIAIDLLRIRQQFEANQLNHNDLHAENLIVEQLKPTNRRSNAIADQIKVRAIDLGSLSGESKSTEKRLGDLHHIAIHIDGLLNLLLGDPTRVDDRDYRIALAMQGIVSGLLSSSQNTRLPDIEDLIKQITDAYARASHPWRPWNLPLNLSGFANHYNAQTLESWDVPSLLVDPDERWLAKTTIPGPQIITGMRGCGKTILLRAVDIHARAAVKPGETPAIAINRIRNDRFVGLFVSAQRLLDLKSQSLYKLEYRLSRLFVSYALQAARALMHIRDLDAGLLTVGCHTKLANAVTAFLEGAEGLKDAVSLDDLELKLTNILVLTIRDQRYSVQAAPNEIFKHLAQEFCGCSELFTSSTVFYLLDDVSTRYHDLDRIEELLSALLFQEPRCAFKFTSEWQTIELGLKSPGREHPIREGRDLLVFDLGADVLETVGSKGNKGKEFVSNILINRAKLHAAHPRNIRPEIILGDVPLETIAHDIASSSETSDHKKNVYRGLSCLTKVCVGDIGDVIKLYEEIIRRAPASSAFPISAQIQSESFRNLGSQRLYDLNRRKGYFKDHALAFAEAAHELLVRSYKIGVKNGKSKPRLRQYTSIYVRVTTDDAASIKNQIDLLRELIDASVFVYSGSAPRTKTRDSNPTQQFILSFRKIYGLSASIGLSDRDRFELSGPDLELWLKSPADAKEILLRNQVNIDDEYLTDNEEVEQPIFQADSPLGEAQAGLFGSDFVLSNEVEEEKAAPKSFNLTVKKLTHAEVPDLKIDTIFTGLGFEDRCLASNEVMASLIAPSLVYGLRYSMEGKSVHIKSAWSGISDLVEVNEVDGLNILPSFQGKTLIDVSGLSKPFIYNAIRKELTDKGRVFICYTNAEKYYPTEEELSNLFAAEAAKNEIKFLDGLAHILNGESGPYTPIRLMSDPSDISRNRALIAFASAKHERLFSLLDLREYDYIDVIGPNSDSPRSKVAAYAAQFACRNYNNSKVSLINTEHIHEMTMHLDKEYLEIYGSQGANVEIGLTGTKLEAISAAILSAKRKISDAWYLKPQQFDEKRFSTGSGEVCFFEICLDQE